MSPIQGPSIENFWGCLAQKIYEGGWEANTEKQLIRRIECKMKEFDTNFVESLLETNSDLLVIMVSICFI